MSSQTGRSACATARAPAVVRAEQSANAANTANTARNGTHADRPTAGSETGESPVAWCGPAVGALLKASMTAARRALRLTARSRSRDRRSRGRTINDRIGSAVMRSQAEHTTRAAWRPTRIATLCSALLVLLATLVVCLVSVSLSHGAGGPVGASTASRESMGPMEPTPVDAVPADFPTRHHGPTGAHSVGCPYGDVCCAPAADRARAVLAVPGRPMPAVLSRVPNPPVPGISSRCAEPAPSGVAPDLHVLQVQRT
ncbi:hypothetical protein [Streptomyces sp. NPDC046862]|uniref:hypothetical protein n=1 Tax=Streptomyces sp. NPDC046862 TaxID=3154603 RepID=UPI0034569712